MYDKLVKRLRDAAKMSEALAVLLPHSEGNAMAKLCNEAADAIEELICEVADEHNTKLDAEETHTMEEFMYGQEGNPNDGSM